MALFKWFRPKEMMAKRGVVSYCKPLRAPVRNCGAEWKFGLFLANFLEIDLKLKCQNVTFRLGITEYNTGWKQSPARFYKRYFWLRAIQNSLQSAHLIIEKVLRKLHLTKLPWALESLKYICTVCSGPCTNHCFPLIWLEMSAIDFFWFYTNVKTWTKRTTEAFNLF